MPLNLWTKEEDEILKNEYYEVGTKLSKKLNRNRKSIINRAYHLGIKTKVTKKVKYCLICFVGLNPYQRNKSGLCHKCSAKKVYNKRGAFSHSYSKLWTKEDIEYLINNYRDMTKSELEIKLNRKWNSIYHKASRIKIYRNPKFMKEGNAKGMEYFKLNNPMLNPKFKEKALIKQAPIFSKNKKTLIEKKVANFLDLICIKYKFNKFVRTKKTMRFPDFTIGKLVIECDGDYWHRNRKKEDSDRQIELEELGYKVIRFNEEKILNNFEEVKKCILLELSRL